MGLRYIALIIMKLAKTLNHHDNDKLHCCCVNVVHFISATSIAKKIGSSYTKSIKPLIERIARRLPNVANEVIEKFFREALPGAITGKGLDKLFKGFLRWLRSVDPVSRSD